MEPFLGNLIRYQEINLELDSLQARLSQIPGKLKTIDDEQEGARSVVEDARARHEASLKGRRDHERELQDLEGKVAKYNDQSRDVKTNEQYRAIMAEIQTVKDKIDQLEEKILLAMDEADELKKQIDEAEKQVAARKPEFDSRRKALQEEKAKLEREREKLTRERAELKPRIRPDLMEAYERVIQLRGSVAVARVSDDRCSACSVRLRPALMAEVRKNDAVHQCESCRRLLYWVPPREEEADGGESAPPPGSVS